MTLTWTQNYETKTLVWNATYTAGELKEVFTKEQIKVLRSGNQIDIRDTFSNLTVKKA